MIQCNLYLTTPSVADFVHLLKAAFPRCAFSGNEEKGPLTVTKKGFFSRQELTFTFLNQTLVGEKFIKMMRGMAGFYRDIPTEHATVRDNVLRQIAGITLAVSVTAKKEMSEADFAGVASLADSAGGFVFLPPGDLYNGKGKLIFSADGETALPGYTADEADAGGRAPVSGAPLADAPAGTASAPALARKAHSEQMLLEYGIPVNIHLPPITDEADFIPRGKEEIVLRATAMLLTSIYAEMVRDNDVAYAQDFVKPLLERYGVHSFLSPAETAFMADVSPAAGDINDCIWRYECYWVALWYLGFVEDLPYPDGICDVSSMVAFLREAKNVDAFIDRAQLRSAEELLNAADFIYRCDWACVDARLKGEDAPAGLEPGVVLERHRMLNWLTRYMDQPWDDITTDT